MKREQTPTRSSENLTRGQKLLRRAVPLALITAGVAGGGAYAGYEALHDDPKKAEKTEAYAQATSHATGKAEIGGSDSGWTHGAAERALQEAIYDGAVNAFANIQTTTDAKGVEFAITTEEIKSIVEALPVYNQANQALDFTDSKAVPDPGDKLLIEVEVTADTDKHVEYEVVDAAIEDIPNNQE